MPDSARSTPLPEAAASPRIQPQPRWFTPSRFSLGLLALAAIAYCTWILSLPLFPTQDGPMHLYFVRIMQALLFHREPGLFPRFFVIKHLAPPYALYYYLLLGIGHFVPLIVADKLVVCLYVFVFLFGFRFLARSVGPSGDSASLLATAYVLNWPLGMGFVNYCLSLALACWALGLWCRVAQQPASPRNAWRLAAFVLLAWAVMLTHPVPLLFLLGFCFVELCVRLARGRQGRTSVFTPALRRDALIFLLAAATLLYVKAFTGNHLARQLDPVNKTYFAQISSVFAGIANFGTVDAFSPHTPLSQLRRLAIYLIFFAALGVAGLDTIRSMRSRSWRVANTCFVLALLLWLFIPILPPDMNNSHLFSSRLMIFAVLAALAAAAGAPLPTMRPNRRLFACAAAALALTAVTLTRAQQAIAPIASTLAQLETGPTIPQGVYLGLLKPDYQKDAVALTYDPFFWNDVRPLRRSDSILFNTPWLDLAIIPVGAQPVLPTDRIDTLSMENSTAMRKTLARSAESRAIIYAAITGAVISHGTAPAPGALDPILQADPTTAHRWVCAPDASASICEADGKAYNQQQ